MQNYHKGVKKYVKLSAGPFAKRRYNSNMLKGFRVFQLKMISKFQQSPSVGLTSRRL